MHISKEGIALIKKSESCVLKVYVDPIGVKTLGYGHTGKDVDALPVGTPVSQILADAFLQIDLEKFEGRVSKYDPIYHWTENEFSALVSFAYNIGSIDQLTANGTRTKQQIADKMLEYNRAGGKVYPGLTDRRKAEREMFIGTKMEGLKEFSLMADGEKKISEHFKVKEFKCKDGSDSILVDCDFVKKYLEAIRVRFGKPVIINSAYRTKSYNQKVGGATNSYHMKGQAFDIVVKGETPRNVSKCAKDLGVKGIIQYNTFTHVDSRESTYYATNNNGKVTVVKDF